MFENYNKYNRPVLKESQAVIVEFDYQLIRIIDVVRHIYVFLCFLNRPFYRYGGHIELIRFKEYYRMPRGA